MVPADEYSSITLLEKFSNLQNVGLENPVDEPIIEEDEEDGTAEGQKSTTN